MANPFSPPTTVDAPIETNLAVFTGRKSVAIGIGLCAFMTVVGHGIHLGCGIPVSSAILENQVWVLLFASLGSLALIFAFNRFAVAGKFTCSIVGLSILAYHLVEFGRTFWVGTNVERFVFYRRALGDYYWVYWALVLTLGVLPLILFIPKINRSARISACCLCLFVFASAFYLRSNFGVKYSDVIPTSWGQFFWPF